MKTPLPRGRPQKCPPPGYRTVLRLPQALADRFKAHCAAQACSMNDGMIRVLEGRVAQEDKTKRTAAAQQAVATRYQHSREQAKSYLQSLEQRLEKFDIPCSLVPLCRCQVLSRKVGENKKTNAAGDLFWVEQAWQIFYQVSTYGDRGIRLRPVQQAYCRNADDGSVGPDGAAVPAGEAVHYSLAPAPVLAEFMRLGLLSRLEDGFEEAIEHNLCKMERESKRLAG